MGKEGGDALHVIERDLESLREIPQCLRRQISVLMLDRAQFVNDDSGTTSAPDGVLGGRNLRR